ncbi:RecQ family ATP-dependent DNA helicase, partial [Fulvivirga sp. RKSG066]|uniref:RecQ family ATP-dependent DNA helicase n=1 Tax=Fulvivirga aurantia TaxID=2529383 RepID=UPI0012BC3949
MSTPQTILKQYWGYDQFRSLQEDIIQSVLAGNDTLALLPTGGGKSICFQVPALIKEGVCVVVTPLIALMKDQVEQLNKRKISATAIYSGLSKREIDIKLDNCVYGQVKFLYVSPERLKTDLFRERLKKMTVALLAIDESHCISQWGYDFRPSYLEIATVRELLPDVPVIALTATATPEVQADIVEKLEFKTGHQHFQKSFSRANLSYAVREEEDKERKLLEVLKSVPGTAIVYARTRKRTKELAALLLKNGLSADFYHAGLSHEERVKKQDNWIKNRTRVIVATNAFGMGIDKPDVRVVVHLDVPENLEAYYQEAGRAGRDEKKAYAVIIYNQLDVELLKERITQEHPPPEFLKQVYQALANYYKLAVGSGEGQAFDFDVHAFSEQYRLNHLQVFYALKKLEEEGFVQLNESFYSPSQLHICVDNSTLYKFQIANAKYDTFIKAILRLYGGELFNGFLTISEDQIAKLLNTGTDKIVLALNRMAEMELVIYDEKKDKPQLVFTQPRQNAADLRLNKVRLKEREQTARKKLDAIINYVNHRSRCRTQLLLEYFGEVSYEKCGVCDYCITEKKKDNLKSETEYHQQIRHLIEERSLSVDETVEQINPKDKELFLEVIREMVDAGELKYN